MGLSGLKLNCQQGCTPFASKGNAALNKAFFFFFFFCVLLFSQLREAAHTPWFIIPFKSGHPGPNSHTAICLNLSFVNASPVD